MLSSLFMLSIISSFAAAMLLLPIRCLMALVDVDYLFRYFADNNLFTRSPSYAITWRDAAFHGC